MESLANSLTAAMKVHCYLQKCKACNTTSENAAAHLAVMVSLAVTSILCSLKPMVNSVRSMRIMNK